MEIRPISVQNTNYNKETDKSPKIIGASSLLSAGAVMYATNAPKGIENPAKLTTRLLKAGKAAAVTAVVIGLITLDKQKAKDYYNTVKNFVCDKLGMNKNSKEENFAQSNAQNLQPKNEIVNNQIPNTIEPEMVQMTNISNNQNPQTQPAQKPNFFFTNKNSQTI